MELVILHPLEHIEKCEDACDALSDNHCCTSRNLLPRMANLRQLALRRPESLQWPCVPLPLFAVSFLFDDESFRHD